MEKGVKNINSQKNAHSFKAKTAVLTKITCTVSIILFFKNRY